MRIIYGASFPNTVLAFLSGQMNYMVEIGHDVHLIAPDSQGLVAEICQNEGVTYHQVEIQRKPNPRHDLTSLAEVAKAVRKVSPDTIVAGTPKASLLLLLAGAALQVPRRVYLCHGLRYEGLTGTKRSLLKLVERLLAMMSTDVVAVSDSVRHGLIECGVPASKVLVLGSGSPNGIDTDYFSPATIEQRASLRSRLGFSENQFVVLFVGRMTHDKGIAFLSQTVEGHPNRHLLIAGTPEPASDEDHLTIETLQRIPNVSLLGRRDDVRDLCRVADVLVLPTLREGLPTVIIEASATGLPVVTMEATGTVDAVRDGITGFIVNQGDADAFAGALDRLESDPNLRERMASEGRQFACENFGRLIVWKNWEQFLRISP